MSALVGFTPRAAREVERIARWWRVSRPAAPRLFDEELQRTVSIVAAAP